NARTTEDDRRQKLWDIVPDDRRVLAAAVDGPLVPGLGGHSKYRACESILSRGVLQRRGKPGPTNGGSGPAVHREATRLARFTLTELNVGESRHQVAIHSEAVVEAFPNLFVGTLCDEKLFPSRPSKKRKWTDTLFLDIGVQRRLKSLLTSLLPQREVRGNWKLKDHEEIAGLVCALTALC